MRQGWHTDAFNDIGHLNAARVCPKCLPEDDAALWWMAGRRNSLGDEGQRAFIKDHYFDAAVSILVLI